ncbi:expressed unknown protein [Seminavis robusta]|uniref:Uncharacterized protein n=1 Tax=Seminavis robusta TaxID=568900 RepID=A0A9N8E6I0_9STRA|nr:expressed unknown protein [Seminavis robusta]|eukprot:Sro602_g173740.1 n/a (158) ;mRNA; f:31011-31484
MLLITRDNLYNSSLLASFLWFGAGFHFFTIQRTKAGELLVPKSQRRSPIYPTLVATGPFLGGFNGAWALLCGILLGIRYQELDLFEAPGERMVILGVISSAHFSQFLGNVPILVNGERRGETYWPVLSGQMMYIFFVDLVQAALAAVAAGAQFFSTE